MFKTIRESDDKIVKSFDIYDIWKFVIDNKQDSYFFLIGYTHLTSDEFLKMFLIESKTYQDYLTLYEVLKTTKTIMYYG